MDSKELLNSSELKSVKDFFKKNRGSLEDIVVIGSSVKGRRKPGDIDIVLVLKESDKKVELIGEFPIEAHLSAVSLQNLFKEPLWRAVIQEGFSLVKNGQIANSLGFESVIFLEFDASNLEHKDRVRFNYALRGRGSSKGMLKGTGSEEKGCYLLVPVGQENEVEAFLDSWKVSYKPLRALVW